MLKAIKDIAIICLCIAGVAAACVFIYWSPYLAGVPPAKEPSAPTVAGFTQAEFISIILTAVTVVLAALAIILAIAAFWGYTAIREGAVEAAKIEARKVARSNSEVVAARVAEEAAQQSMERAFNEGDAIANAAGMEDGNDA